MVQIDKEDFVFEEFDTLKVCDSKHSTQNIRESQIQTEKLLQQFLLSISLFLVVSVQFATFSTNDENKRPKNLSHSLSRNG